MSSQVSPGVVIKERDLSNAVVVGASSITGAFASSFRTGPVGKIVNISSERELIDVFGAPAEANASDWLVASEFLRYGGRLAVVRATSGVLNSTASGTGALVASKEDFDAGATTEKFAARYAGADGNNLRVVIVDRGADYTVTKNAHGWSVGGTYTDGNGTAHEIVSKTTNTADIIQNGAVAPTATGGATVAAFDWNFP